MATSADALKAHGTGDGRPARYVEDGVVVYRASGLNGCLRAFVAAAAGEVAHEPPDDMKVIFGEGHLFEGVIRDMYQDRTGFEVVEDDGWCELDLGVIHGRPVVVRGRTDGQVDFGNGAGMLFEAKKVRAGERDAQWKDFINRGVEFHHNYPWQVSAYMLGRGLRECDFVGGKLTTGEDGEYSLDDIYIHHITQPPINLLSIKRRVSAIEDVIAEGFAPADVECKDYYPCPYYQFHDIKDEVEVAVLDEAKYGDLVRGQHEATVQAKEADARKRKAAKALREQLKEDGLTDHQKLTVGDLEVTHVVRNIKEHVVKASIQDYYTIKGKKK